MAVFWKPDNLKLLNKKRRQEQTQKEEIQETQDALIEIGDIISQQQEGIVEIQDALIEIAGIIAEQSNSEQAANV